MSFKEVSGALEVEKCVTCFSKFFFFKSGIKISNLKNKTIHSRIKKNTA